MQYAQTVIIQERDCILIEGKKYCRDEDVTPKEVVGVLLIVGLFLGLICGWAWCVLDGPLGDYPKEYTVVLPLVILGIIGTIYVFI